VWPLTELSRQNKAGWQEPEAVNLVFVSTTICLSMQHPVFAFSLVKEGTTEKALKFIMLPNSIYNINFGFIEQKMYF
jgi:hypothetical protein